MNRPFSVEMRRYEIIGGCVYLAFYLFVMSSAVHLVLNLLGLPVDTVTLNKIYFFANFIITAVLFRRFLAYSLPMAADQPLRFLKGILLGFCIYEGCQVALGILCGLIAPNLWTPNDDNIRSIAAESYRVMWVGAVLLAPLTEETLIRGLVFGNLRRKNRVLAYIITALVFGLMHIVVYIPRMDVVTLVLNLALYAFPSAALCAAYEYAGTIWAPIALHMILNALSMGAIG